MSKPSQHASGARRSATEMPAASHVKPGFPARLYGCLVFLAFLAVFSTLAGYQAARFQDVLENWMGAGPAHAASSALSSPAFIFASEPNAGNQEAVELSRLAPQQQAERLLELAIRRDEFSLDLIHRHLDAWRGHLEDTDSLFHLVLAALDSDDPRVRVVAVEIDLAANNLSKSPRSVAQLLNQIHNDPDGRYLALWRLGSLGNRGVEPATALATLLRYAHDRNQQTRFWAVEGLAMLGSEDSIDPLLSILAHDPSQEVRERAACNLARSGMLTGEQRLTAVPQLLNLLDDDSLNHPTQDLVFAALHAITGASLGRNIGAWRAWWAHHDRPEKSSTLPPGLLLT
jgi:HEAT repeat protein